MSTAEGQATGLVQDSVVCCLFLATVAETRLSPAIGRLSDTMKLKLNDCLKTAMELP